MRHRKRRYSFSTASAFAALQPSPDGTCISFSLIGLRSSFVTAANRSFMFMVVLINIVVVLNCFPSYWYCHLPVNLVLPMVKFNNLLLKIFNNRRNSYHIIVLFVMRCVVCVECNLFKS